MMENNPRVAAGSSRTGAEDTITKDAGAIKSKRKPISSLDTSKFLATKKTTSEVYLYPKKATDKIGPGPVTERKGPKLTARDVPRTVKQLTISSKSSKDNLHSKTFKPPVKTGVMSKGSVGNNNKKEDSKSSLQEGNSSGSVPPKKLIKMGSVDVSKRTVVTSKNIKSSGTEIKSSKRDARSSNSLPFVGLLANSPTEQRKISTHFVKSEYAKEDNSHKKEQKILTMSPMQGIQSPEGTVMPRERGKTITLNDNEVKILHKDGIDNDKEMKNLTKMLKAQPKAYYIDFNEDKQKLRSGNSDDECSYEDDFESYESDFESYKSDSEKSSLVNEHSFTDAGSSNEDKPKDEIDNNMTKAVIESENAKISQIDDERMLDSGNFDLREAQKSASKGRPYMDDILESGEVEEVSKKQVSLTDEGFMEMSSSSAAPNTLKKTNDTERPTFINLTRSKENRKRRILTERLRQRATDLLSMITLHEVSYILYDLKPIPYDRFMAVYGNINSSQSSSQTYDDGISEEIQTEYIQMDSKWTQQPIEFSNHEVHINEPKDYKKIDNFESKFSFLWNPKLEIKPIEESYRKNPLRIFLEQKNGVGNDRVMPYESYQKITKMTQFKMERLSKFLKKAEKKINRIVSKTNTVNGTIKPSNWPFSKGYVDLMENVENNSQLYFLHRKPVNLIAFSETSNNLILTVHNKIDLNSEELETISYDEMLTKKCLVCLWDFSIANQGASRMPLKVLAAVDNIAICRYRGDSDGLVAAALDDGSIHLWDLSEADCWHGLITNSVSAQPTRDRTVQDEASSSGDGVRLRWCGYADSACAVEAEVGAGAAGGVVGLLLLPGPAGGTRALAQLCSLSRHGVLTFWTIIQEKHNVVNAVGDIGKAYWSKIKLHKIVVVDLTENMDLPFTESSENEKDFNLAAVKLRMAAKRSKVGRKTESKPLSSKILQSKEVNFATCDMDSVTDESLGRQTFDSWERGLLCTDLKVMWREKVNIFLVARNCGEVLCCERNEGVFKVKRLKIACDATTITTVEPSGALPYLLAGTDRGVVHLVSLADGRSLIALDCWAGGGGGGGDRSHEEAEGEEEEAVRCVRWAAREPCSLLALCDGTLCRWELARGDAAPAWRVRGARRCELAPAGDVAHAAVVMSNGSVEIHQLPYSSRATVDQETFHYCRMRLGVVALQSNVTQDFCQCKNSNNLSAGTQ